MMEPLKQTRRDILAWLGSTAAISIFPCHAIGESPPGETKTSVDTAAALAAAQSLIQRIVPERAEQFTPQWIPPENGCDVFEVESRNGKIVLRGNHVVSIASALNHYLKHFCQREVSWWRRDTSALPNQLPTASRKIHRTASFQYRAYLNYCTFSYTAPWWDWERWQREIDWMAMHGINMPLAITGQESVWQNMLRRFHMSDNEIRSFLCGPAFFAWQWMANLEGWGGPLPQSWIDSHQKLGRQILDREREFGMTPVLQGFTGFIPRAIKDKFPDARIQFKPNWCNVFKGTAQLDPLDPLFRKMGTAFLEEQQKLFGTDHLYAADPFHESKPPSDVPEYLAAVAKEILNTMTEVDPDAKIVMQTWSLRKPLVTNIPESRIELLALEGSGWEKTEGFWNRPWTAGVLHNYGGRVFMAGSLEKTLRNALTLRANSLAGHVTGIGLFPEATEQNPVFYEAASEITWMHEPPDPEQWLHDEITARYGKSVPQAQETWKLLLQSIYSDGAETGSVESPICSRPALYLDRAAPNATFQRHYDPNLVWLAWETFLSAAGSLSASEEYQYDLADLSRQGLADLSIPLQREITTAYLKSDIAALKTASDSFLELAMDMDILLASRPEFLLGKWLGDAKRCATNDSERRQYERNARFQITVWGPSAPDAMLFDYANKQWSGLIRGYYVPRWKWFLDYLADQPAGEARFTGNNLATQYKRPSDQANAFYEELSQWEQDWCNHTESYPGSSEGNTIQIASRLFSRWNPVRVDQYKRYNLQQSFENPNAERQDLHAV
jgi:alpha-N-acetylglucosaminidase